MFGATSNRTEGFVVTTPPALPALSGDDTLYIRLARDLAIDMRQPEEIRETYGLTYEQWDTILDNEYFQKLLHDERVRWLSANNVNERVKLKAAAMVEEWLPELFGRLHDPRESLNAKVAAGQLVTKLAGMGIERAAIEGGGERFSININLGAEKSFKIERTISPTINEIDYEDA